MATTIEKVLFKGGEFLIKPTSFEDIFIPEAFDEEQLMVKQMCIDFYKNEIEPNKSKIEKREENIAVTLLDKMAELVCWVHISPKTTVVRVWIPIPIRLYATL